MYIRLIRLIVTSFAFEGAGAGRGAKTGEDAALRRGYPLFPLVKGDDIGPTA